MTCDLRAQSVSYTHLDVYKRQLLLRVLLHLGHQDGGGHATGTDEQDLVVLHGNHLSLVLSDLVFLQYLRKALIVAIDE